MNWFLLDWCCEVDIFIIVMNVVEISNQLIIKMHFAELITFDIVGREFVVVFLNWFLLDW